MSSNFVKNASVIKKQFNSGTTFLGGNSTKSNINDNYAWEHSSFTSNIGSSNICYPLNHNFQTNEINNFSGNRLTNFGTTSNALHPSGGFNIIKVDLSSMRSDQQTRLEVYYSKTRDLNDAIVKYTTIFKESTNFYRNYPVENNYFTIALTNMDETPNQTSVISGEITLSKYTEFNAPIQILDETDRYMMSNLTRNSNNFKNDVIISRVADVLQTDVISNMDSDNGLVNKICWNADMTNNYDFSVGVRPMVVRSDNSKEGIGIAVSTLTTNGLVVNNILSNGTSNVGLMFDAYFVGDIRCSSQNTGNIVVADRDNGRIYNYCDALSGRSTSLNYISPNEGKAIIEDLNLSGRLALEQKNNFKLEKLNFTSNTRSVIYQTNKKDCSLENNVKLNSLLNGSSLSNGVYIGGNDCIIGSMVNGLGDTTAYEFSQLATRLNITEYRETSRYK